MSVPQSDVSPEERAARLLRAERDREMSRPEPRPEHPVQRYAERLDWQSALKRAWYNGCPEPDYGHWKRTGEVWPGQRASSRPEPASWPTFDSAVPISQQDVIDAIRGQWGIDASASPNLLLDCDDRPVTPEDRL